MDWAKTTARRDEKHLWFGIGCDLDKRIDGNFKHCCVWLFTYLPNEAMLFILPRSQVIFEFSDATFIVRNLKIKKALYENYKGWGYPNHLSFVQIRNDIKNLEHTNYYEIPKLYLKHSNGLAQDCGNSISSTLSCAKPSIYRWVCARTT